MRWKCDKDGCFEEKMRVKLGFFDECFPGTNGLTDLDGFLYLKCKNIFIFIEWKSNGIGINGKQAEAVEALSKIGYAFVIHGNAETMEIFAWREIKDGVYGEVNNDSLSLKLRFVEITGG